MSDYADILTLAQTMSAFARWYQSNNAVRWSFVGVNTKFDNSWDAVNLSMAGAGAWKYYSFGVSDAADVGQELSFDQKTICRRLSY